MLCLGALACLGAALTAQVPVVSAKQAAADAARARPASHAKTAAAVRRNLLERSQRYLDREDPWRAVLDLKRLAETVPDADRDRELQLGLAHTFLMLGHSRPALTHLRKAAKASAGEDLSALKVRILLRAARFKQALEVSSAAVAARKNPDAELLAAHASALFRLQRVREAARFYRRVLRLVPLHAEAHLRLGSGLAQPRKARVTREIEAGIVAYRRAQLTEARDQFRQALRVSPGHPTAHRLLGETLQRLERRHSMADNSEAFARLAAAVPLADVRELPIQKFVPAYGTLAAPRRAVVARAVSMFPAELPKLVAIGGRHDLLALAERTTDRRERRGLRGKRTFDGRIWDDVRGIGGLQAATGIEALDEARSFSFNTVAHEIAHQAHLFAFRQVKRLRVRRLYYAAKVGGRCLDFYAASNEAEYFGQGVEAFVSFAKRPGSQKTHGHTRFELYRVDRDLHALIAGLVGFDPLRDPQQRRKLLPLCAEVALQCGRPRDALVAAEMMVAGPARELLLQRAREACKVLGLPASSQ
ncbi:MAG: hypothetical protein ACYTGW_20405 [Planctomycetota bacterium]